MHIVFGCDEGSDFVDLEDDLKLEESLVMGWAPDCKYSDVYGGRDCTIIKIAAVKSKVMIAYDWPVKFDKDCSMIKTLQKAYKTVAVSVMTTGGVYAKCLLYA